MNYVDYVNIISGELFKCMSVYNVERVVLGLMSPRWLMGMKQSPRHSCLIVSGLEIPCPREMELSVGGAKFNSHRKEWTSSSVEAVDLKIRLLYLTCYISRCLHELPDCVGRILDICICCTRGTLVGKYVIPRDDLYPPMFQGYGVLARLINLRERGIFGV